MPSLTFDPSGMPPLCPLKIDLHTGDFSGHQSSGKSRKSGFAGRCDGVLSICPALFLPSQVSG